MNGRSSQDVATVAADDPGEQLRRYTIQAAPIFDQLAEVRAHRTYCEQYEDSTAPLDELELVLLRRLADLRRQCGVVVH